MRIGIVNNKMLENLRQIISKEPNYEIAWVACSGVEAVTKCAVDTPDLILMDLVMPIMDGVEATRQIMNESPCPILIVTETIGENAAKVFQAIGYGALDAVDAPLMGNHVQAQCRREAFLRKINTMARLQGLSSAKYSRQSFEKLDITPKTLAETKMTVKPVPPLIAIGSSTGGPKALVKVLSSLPTTLGAVIVIVQHVNEEFSAGFADWLNAQSPLNVCLAIKGGQPEVDTVYIAGTNDHLILTASLTFAYTPEPRSIHYRPSVDIFFNSAAKHWPQKSLAVLLTGMGRDGAKGLASLREAGWHTIAQDEATSVVYGMPKAAKELGAAVEILPLDQIGTAMVNYLNNLKGDQTVR